LQSTATSPSPSYHRREVQAQAQRARALHINALTLIETLHLLAFCRLAVQVAHRRCPPRLPKGAGGRPRTSCEESLLLIALLKTLWRLSYQDVHEWLQSWPALALACGLPLASDGQPCIPSPSQLCNRELSAGAPPFESLFVLTVWRAVRCHLIGARDLMIDSAPILAWRRTDPDAATGHASAHHPRPRLARLSRPYLALSRLWLARAFPALSCQLPQCPLCSSALRAGRPPLPHPSTHHLPGCRLLGPATYPLDSRHVGSGRRHCLELEATKEPLLFATYVDQEELGKRSSIERFFGHVFLFFRSPAYSGWSTIVRQVALTSTASLVVGLAARQAHRPDLICSPKRVLAHLWEVPE
jgi:hypothetical protein